MKKFLVPIGLPADPQTPLQAATKQYVDAKTAPDEVWIGTTPPVDPAIELWVDSDAVAPLTEDLRWNTAWGVVVPRTAVSNTAVSGATLFTLHTLNATLVAGRRYAVRIGNVGSYATVVGDTFNIGAQLDGASVGSSAFAVDVVNNYLSPGEFTLPFESSAGAHAVTIWTQRVNGTGGYQARWHASIEDIGPVSGSFPAPNPTPAWIPLTLNAPWVNLGGNWQVASYRKVGDEVQLRGGISGGAVGNVVSTLPVGYRPPADLIFPVEQGPVAHGRLDVIADGRLVPANNGAGQYMSLSSIRFSVSA